jgi:hypothetical protein
MLRRHAVKVAAAFRMGNKIETLGEDIAVAHRFYLARKASDSIFASD